MSHRTTATLEQMVGYIDTRGSQFGNSLSCSVRKLVDVCSNPSAPILSISELGFDNFVEAQKCVAIMHFIETLPFTPKRECLADMVIFDDRHVVAVERFGAGDAH